MNNSIISNETFIEEILKDLPKLPPKKRKNLYDIFGVKRKETINSKVLAYFLDANEEHKLNTLFFDSLKNVLNKKGAFKKTDIEAFRADFLVITEDTTIYAQDENQQKKRIDISIEGSDWCIIIENKLYHTLQNPLEIYWEHKHQKYPENKIGIILSIKAIPQKNCIAKNGIEYTNITHRELIYEIKKNITLENHNNRTDVFYLNEYFKTMESHYKTKQDEAKLNKTIKVLINKKKEIDIIEKSKKEALVFLKDKLEAIFKDKGFEKNKYGNYMHPNYAKLLFVVNDKDIIESNRLWFSFEIWNMMEKDIDTWISNYSKKSKKNKYIKYGDGVTSKNGKIQLCIYDNTEFIDSQMTFSEKFEHLLDNYLFNGGGIVEQTELFFKIKKN